MTDLNALHYTPEHEWISIEGDVATIGITDYAAEKLGDVVFVELPAIDSGVTAGQVVGEIESTKSVGELFEGGWLIKVRVATGELPAGLLDRAGYVALTGESA